jgi:CRISPR-associated endonuclease/helicase Cas3
MKHFKTFDDALTKAGFSRRGEKLPPGFHSQEDVFDAFRRGNHIILKAPTGWGKTFAVAAAVGEGHAIYSLPLRVLADTISEAVNDYTDGVKEVAVQHGANKGHTLLDPIPMKKEDERRFGMVFTTLDQTLSAFLGIPIGVKYRQGNILPAVVDASHLIFDEFHLFEPARSMTTALFALEQSKQACIVLTATLSDPMITFLEETLKKSVVGQRQISKGEKGVEIIRGSRPFVNDKTLRIGEGLEKVESLDCSTPLTLIIRNQIEWAKETATKLREKYKNEAVDIHLLHSELLPNDRKNIEENVVKLFADKSKRKENGRRQILVSTQVVEAGVDITCDVLHTDWCPPASFIQRAGRCARYKGESAKIYWHPVPEEYGPYQGQKADVDKLASLLLLNEQELLSPALEDEVVQLSAESDRVLIENYQHRNAKQETRRLRTSRNYEAYEEMIRSINSVNAAIGDKPEEIGSYLSLSRSSFYGRFQDAQFTGYRYNSDTKEMEALDTGKSEETYKYVQLSDLILFHPDKMSYSPQLGLTVGQSGGREYFLKGNERMDFENYGGYYLEPYQAHIEFLHLQKDQFGWIRPSLSQELTSLGLSGEASEMLGEALVDLVIWGHDLGKLDFKWQAAHSVDEKGVPYDYPGLDYVKGKLKTLIKLSAPIAHSETGGYYDRLDGVKTSSHAWVSAWAIKSMVYKMLGDDERLVLPVLWAIAEHHGYLRTFDGALNLNRFEAYELGYLDYLDKMSELAPWTRYGWSSKYLNTKIDRAEALEAHAWFEANPILPEHAINVYYILSYVLRRCDWFATAEVSNPSVQQRASSKPEPITKENSSLV